MEEPGVRREPRDAYGPPAVGKLTVARAIARHAPFRVLHNHVTIDAVGAVLDFGTPAFWGVVERFRRDLVQTAAEQGVDLLYTYVYAPGDEPHVDSVVNAFKHHGGRVLFVQLLAPREELLRRVTDESRAAYGKIADTETLRKLLDQYDLYCRVRGRSSLELDIATLSADEAARRIIEYVGSGSSSSST